MALVSALKQELEETQRWPISSQHLAWVVQKLDIAIHHIIAKQWISITKTNCVIQWITPSTFWSTGAKLFSTYYLHDEWIPRLFHPHPQCGDGKYTYTPYFFLFWASLHWPRGEQHLYEYSWPTKATIMSLKSFFWKGSKEENNAIFRQNSSWMVLLTYTGH